MTTAREAISDALRSLQVYAPGEDIADADLAQGLVTANDMLRSWSNEQLTCYATLQQSVTFNPGQYQYTLGPGGDIDGVRPLRLTGGFGTAFILDQTGNRYPLTILELDKWEQIGNIAQVNANIPQYLYYDPQFPRGILNFYPIPNIGYQAFWDSYLQFTGFQFLDQNVNLPDGYGLAIKRCLAVELITYYPDSKVTPTLLRSADTAKANVKRTNTREVVAQYEGALISRSKATYNIFRDSPGSG